MEIKLIKIRSLSRKRILMMTMRTFIFLLCTTVFSFNAESSLAQEKVTIDHDKTLSVNEVFDIIINQTKYNFIYPANLFNNLSKVDLKKGKISVGKLLQQALPKGKFNVILGINNRISIKKKGQSQQQRVSGKVTDEGGGALPGVTVQVKGSSKATATDFNGEYSTQVPDSESVLVFSSIGFTPQEIVVGNENVINVVLKENISELEEVVLNAGYYYVKERERTGSISKVSANEIEMQPIISPIDALQGRMAGVEILPHGNLPGMASTIRIRGRNSLRSEGNFPMYIVDGVPINSTPVNSNSLIGNPGPGIDPLNNLNLSNIESIEILKDADATAIYGSRGANGVILITSKKGKQKNTEIETRLYLGTASVPKRIDLLNTEQYLRIRKKAFENDGVAPSVSNAYDLLVWDQSRYTDWQDVFFGGSSTIKDINIAASGGNDTTSFRLGGSYHEQGTIYPGDYSYNKMTAGLNLSHLSENKKLRIDLNLNFGIDFNNLVGNLSLTSNAFSLAPNAPEIFNSDGSLHWEGWESVGLKNPFEGYYNQSETQTKNIVSNIGMSYQLVKNLNVKTNIGYNDYNSEELIKFPKRSYSPSNWETTNHLSSLLHYKGNSWVLEPQLVYGGKIGDGKLDALLGGTFQKSENNLLSLQGKGYISEDLIGNLGAAESIINPSNSNAEYRYNAIFGRLGYNWKSKYFINLTGRRDGSSRFGPDKRFANFWAVGTAWIFSEELSIKKHLPFLSFGKLRGSYGTTGSDQIGNYGYLDAYEATGGPGGLYPTQLSNPDYSWEINKKLEVAAEFGFAKDKIHFGLSWYRNQSSSQLVGYPLPTTTGFTNIQANLPATVQNTGWELEASTLNIKNQNFQWQTFLNVSIPKNKLLNYPDIEQSSYANIFRVGHPLDIALLYQYDGIDSETEYYRVADINEDGRYDYEDRTIIRELGRKFYGGINNNFRYKDFSLQFLWQFVKQKGTLTGLNAGALSNQHATVLDAFNDDSRFQRISQSRLASTAYSNVLNTNFPVVDASYLRLKTLSLGYSFSTELTKTIGINAGNLFLTGQNLLTVTKYDGMDPEMPSGGTSFSGLRTITLGLQLNF